MKTVFTIAVILAAIGCYQIVALDNPSGLWFVYAAVVLGCIASWAGGDDGPTDDDLTPT